MGLAAKIQGAFRSFTDAMPGGAQRAQNRNQQIRRGTTVLPPPYYKPASKPLGTQPIRVVISQVRPPQQNQQQLQNSSSGDEDLHGSSATRDRHASNAPNTSGYGAHTDVSEAVLRGEYGHSYTTGDDEDISHPKTVKMTENEAALHLRSQRLPQEEPRVSMLTRTALIKAPKPPVPREVDAGYAKVVKGVKKYSDYVAKTRYNATDGSLERSAKRAGVLLDQVLASVAHLQGTLKALAPRDPDFKTNPLVNSSLKIQRQVDETKEALKTLTRTLDRPNWTSNNRDSPRTLQEAIELTRLGFKPGAEIVFDQKHTDGKIKVAQDGFASGFNNSVAKIVYGDGDARILKTETGQRGAWRLERALGIPEKNPTYAARNLASGIVDEALGLRLLPKSGLALHNGALNLTMTLAPGRSGASCLFKHQLTKGLKTDDAMLKTIEAIKQNSPRNVSAELAKLGVTATRNSRGHEIFLAGGPPTKDAVVKNPELMQAMNRLEWLDCLVAQPDRHMGNLFIDFSPGGDFQRLTGIDNDMAFGSRATDMDQLKIQHPDYRSFGMPAFIDAELAATLRKPGTWTAIESRISTLLSPEEVAATKGRFDLARDHIGSMAPDHVIQDWSRAVDTVLSDGKESYPKKFNEVQNNVAARVPVDQPYPGDEPSETTEVELATAVETPIDVEPPVYTRV